MRKTLSINVLRDATVSGRFKPSKCYDALSANNFSLPNYKQVWCSLVAPNHRFVFWLVVLQKLSTKDRLAAFIPGVDPICPICGSEEESH